MRNLIDIDKLVTINKYAKREGVTTMSVYRWIKDKRIKSMEIDGVKFVVLETAREKAPF